jgi:epoxyqueuosine reductase
MDEVRALIGSEVKSTLAVDSKPLLERALARSASLGFTGKNTLLIVPRSARFHMRSWIFLSEVLLDIPYEGDPGPDILDGCGSCTKCLTACPTGAFEGPYRLRADSCISYLTIENKGGIPFEFREKLGDWIFGCDICQDVCPFNARAFETRWPEFSADRGAGPWMSLSEILAIPDQSSFKAQWGQTPLARAKRKGLVRNACVAAGNSKDESLLPFLDALLSDEESLVRGHALWALSKIRPGEKTRLAADRLWKNDSDEGVRRECEVVLQ